MEDQPKWIAKSLTLWGAVVTAVPVIAPLIGVDISPDDVATIGDSGVSIINAGFGIVGAVMVIYGRLRASTKATMLPKG